MNRFFYLTQYDYAGMFDRDIVATLERNHKKVNKDKMAELLELLPGVSDKYNQVIYNLLMGGNINDENIDEFIEIWAELEKGNISNALKLLDIDYYEILQSNDNGFYKYDDIDDLLGDVFDDYIISLFVEALEDL